MPDWKLPLRKHLDSLHLSPAREADIVNELSEHLESRYEELLGSGLSPDEARRLTIAELIENDQLIRELRPIERRETASANISSDSRFHLFADLSQDIRHSARLLRKNPVFTLITVITLALGIGANTAIFTLINAIMLRPLPVKSAHELVLFKVSGPGVPLPAAYNFSFPLYEIFRNQTQSFSGVIAANNVWRGRFVVQDGNNSGAAESIQQQRVTGNFFSTLQVDAIKGRLFTEADDNPSNEGAAVISYDYWQRRFALDPNVVGRKVSVNNTPLTIVGVTPPGFFGFDVSAKPELWWPIKAIPDPNLKRTGSWWIRVLGRVRPGVTRQQAQAEVETIFRRRIEDEGAGTIWSSGEQKRNHFERQAVLESGSAGYTSLRRQFRQPLLILMATVGLVLLICCVNVANLLLSRAAARRKEIAVRLALGANRFRLMRQLLTESILLSVVGGVASLVVAQVCLKVLTSYLPAQSQSALDLLPDARVLGFLLGLSLFTGLLFGLTPALQGTRLSLTGALRDNAGGSAGPSRLAVNKFLVVAQVALSLFLLIGAGLFVRSLRNLRTVDVGMNYDNIVQFSLDTGSAYNVQQRNDLYKRVLESLETLPGAESATLLYFSLLGGGSISYNFTAPEFSGAADANTECYEMAVGPKFFETMKMPILAGRDFGSQDERPISAPPRASDGPKNLSAAPALHAVINQTMARYFYGTQNPIGKRFIQKGTGQQYEVIGVTQDAKYESLREQPSRTYYLYYFEQPQRGAMTFQLRTTDQATNYAGTIPRMMREMDPQVQVIGLETMQDVIDQSIMQERFVAQVASAFSVIALMLACLGLYGVMSHAVTRRTNEIGIRMALGARNTDVVGLVMREVALLVCIGAVIGLAAALATMRLVSNLLFELRPNDPLTIVCATLVLLTVAALAGYLPARRASRVDPLIALRWE